MFKVGQILRIIYQKSEHFDFNVNSGDLVIVLSTNDVSNIRCAHLLGGKTVEYRSQYDNTFAEWLFIGWFRTVSNSEIAKFRISENV